MQKFDWKGVRVSGKQVPQILIIYDADIACENAHRSFSFKFPIWAIFD